MPTAEVLKARTKLPEMESEVRIKSLDWEAFEGREPPAFQWLIPHWLSLHPTLLAGAGGVGKSRLAQAMGTALAIGHPFIGDINRPYNVGLFMCEDDQDELHRRQAAINAHFDVDWQDLGHLHIAVREGMSNTLYEAQFGELRFTSTFEQMRQWVNDERIEVLFIDNVSQVYAGPAGDNGAVTRFVNGLRGIWRDFKGAPVLLAHPARAHGSEFSGAAAWENSVRMRWWLSNRPPDEAECEDEESNILYLAKRKSNYSQRDIARLTVVNGVPVPDAYSGKPFAAKAEAARVEGIVQTGLRRLLELGQTPSDKTGANYMPKLLVKFKLNEGATLKQLDEGMRGLMLASVIGVDVVGTYANRTPKKGLVLRT